MNSAKKYTSPGEESWTLWEWRLELQWVGEVHMADFCCRFGVCWGMLCCYSASNLPLHLLGGASLRRARDEHSLIREADWIGEGRWPTQQWREWGGVQEPRRMLPWVRRVEEEPRKEEDMFRAATEGCCNKHRKNAWMQGNGPIFLIYLLKGLFLCIRVAVPEGGVLFMSLI